MILAGLDCYALDIPFRTVFRHAGAARRRTEAVVVAARTRSGIAGHGEACPRSYVTGESIESVCRFVDRHRSAILDGVTDLPTLLAWRDRHVADIAANPSAWAALELALLDAIGRTESLSLEALLGLPPLAGCFRYSAVLGDAPGLLFRLQLMRYRRNGFTDYKIKLSGDPARDRRKLAPFRDSGARLRADANNLWPDAASAIAALRSLAFGWFALEEPVAAHRLEDCRRISDALGSRIVLDESFLDARILDQLHDTDRWILNLRVSKLGGITRALAALRAARERGLRVLVGAHVGETSILSRAALTLAAAAGEALVAQEGAFGTHLLQRDVANPVLMFGDGGVLHPTDWGLDHAPGLGLAIVPI